MVCSRTWTRTVQAAGAWANLGVHGREGKEWIVDDDDADVDAKTIMV